LPERSDGGSNIVNRKLWERLQRFESRDYVTRHYQKHHGKTLNAQRAHEIGSCFTQGREYFRSASDASDTVQPLLLYYSVASIARGVTLLMDASKREESLTPGHGLITIDWPKTLHAGIANVLNLRIQATRGTFPEFVKAVGNGESYAWLTQTLQPGFFKQHFEQPRFLADQSLISLDDLLSRERDLAAEYEIANDGWGSTDFGTVMPSEAGLRVYIDPVKGREMAGRISAYGFPEGSTVFAAPNPRFPQIQSLCVEIGVKGEDMKKVLPMATGQDQGLGWLIQPFANGDKLIELHRMFLQAYIFGMLSRYFPSKWMAILRSDKGDIARSVILAAIARIETKFPELIGDQLPS